MTEAARGRAAHEAIQPPWPPPQPRTTGHQAPQNFAARLLDAGVARVRAHRGDRSIGAASRHNRTPILRCPTDKQRMSTSHQITPTIRKVCQRNSVKHQRRSIASEPSAKRGDTRQQIAYF